MALLNGDGDGRSPPFPAAGGYPARRLRLVLTHKSSRLLVPSAGGMTGVHARFPPRAGIRPVAGGLSLPTSHQGCGASIEGRRAFRPVSRRRRLGYALSLRTSHQGCWCRARRDDGRSRPFPAAGGYSARRLRRVGRDGPIPAPPPARRRRRRAGGGRGAKVALADPCYSTGLIPLTRKRVVNDPPLDRSLGRRFVGRDKP